MAQTTFSFSADPLLTARLQEKMYRQQWRQMKFAALVGPEWIKRRGRSMEEIGALGPEIMSPSGNIIDTADAFSSLGGTQIYIPVRNRLIQKAKLGDTDLTNTGEPPAFAFRQVQINQTGKVYTPPVGMQLQKVKQWTPWLINDAREQLTTWNNEWFGMAQIQLSFYTGYSYDIVGPVNEGGIGQAIVSHPNFYVAGYGRVAWDPTANGGNGGFTGESISSGTSGSRPGTAAYEALIEAALNGLVDQPQCKMSVQLLRNLRVVASRDHKIAPLVTKNGTDFYLVCMDERQFIQLTQDPEYSSLLKSLHISKLEDHPLASLTRIFIEGCAIMVDNRMYCAYTNQDDAGVTAGTVEYGPRPTTAERNLGYHVGNPILNPIDMGNKSVGFILGQSALTVGVAEKPYFTEEKTRHGRKHEIAIQYIQSVVRNETYDRDGVLVAKGIVPKASDFYENTGSLAFATYSPFALKWN